MKRRVKNPLMKRGFYHFLELLDFNLDSMHSIGQTWGLGLGKGQPHVSTNVPTSLMLCVNVKSNLSAWSMKSRATHTRIHVANLIKQVREL